jgi:hypothetical protein
MFLALVLAGTTAATPQSQQPTDASPSRDHSPHPTASTVWVNTSSGYYHKPDSRHYGKTKHGKYMIERDALRAGYRPARNRLVPGSR